MNRLVKGDKVRVISGKLKGSQGIILSINLKEQTAIVEGINKIKKSVKPNQNNDKGGIIEIDGPIKLCKLALIDPKGKGKVTKVSYKIDPKTKKKARFAKVSGVNLSVTEGK